MEVFDGPDALEEVTRLHDTLVASAMQFINKEPWRGPEISTVLTALLLFAARLSVMSGQPLNLVMESLRGFYDMATRNIVDLPPDLPDTESN